MSRNARALVAVVVDGAERVAHAELGDHRARDVGGALQVVLRAGRDLAERDLLGRAAAEQHRELAEQIAARHQVAILERQLHRVAERAEAALHDRDLVHRVEVRAARVATIAWPDSWYATISRSFVLITRFFSSPAISRSIADSKSCMSTAVLSLRAASSAASFTRLARSAPAKPAVRAATTLQVDVRRRASRPWRGCAGSPRGP